MSKKNLAKTTIEGGRYGRNKWERRNSHTVERTSERDYCRQVLIDPDLADDDFFITEKEKVYKDFNDKLGAMYRWLHSQIGKPWADVRSEVCQKFDSRTTAGRHILYDHLLSSVEEVPDLRFRRWYRDLDNNSSHYKNDFYVDDEGLLRAKKYIPRHQNKIPKFNTQAIANWLHGRVVGKVGNKLFWFIPVNKTKKYGGSNKEWKTEWQAQRYYGSGLSFLYAYQKPIYSKNKEGILEIVGHEAVWVKGTPTLRQDRKLNEKEMIFWNSMPQWHQTKILEHSPTYPEELKPSYGDSYYY